MSPYQENQSRLLLKLDSFQVHLANKPLFQPLDLELHEGEVVIVQGPNGAGKTTLMRAILGLHQESSGTKFCRVSTKETVYQAQSHNISSHLPFTVGDVVTVGTGITYSKMIELGLVDEKLAKRQWNSASGGERQRALISRSMLFMPRLMLLDEPFNHLDSQFTRLVLQRLGHFFAGPGLPSMVIIAHGEERQMLIDAFNPKLMELKPIKGAQ